MAWSDHWRCVSMRHQGTTFLKGHFQTPTRNFVADDPFCRQSEVGGKDGFWRCIGYLGHPFEKEIPWAFIARLFLTVSWDPALERAGALVIMDQRK